ncbi:MAG: tRNA pseudouridine(38-40) synthase TruA [Parachlamydia sp.]|jgi:tRNA pseudouridine38-40 synthase|nr:tRNA pseudouridine(38-40) synthase TruA [Parachlamydia sp.]
MHCYKLTLAYDGTHYSGWQIQSNAVTIQQLLNKALKILLKNENAFATGSGRTDAGVHAKGQTAHFKSDEPLDAHRFLFSLNGLLPKDIRALNIEEAAPHFHAQYDAKGKEYHYYLHLDRVMDPFYRLYRWHYYNKIDRSLLREAATLFIGKHDFSAFANESHAGSAAKNPVRTLYRLDCVDIEGGLRLEFEGDGFLYKMVRNITGTLVAVASRKRPLADIPLLFASKDRRQASLAAPPRGLFLMRVRY